MIDPDEASFPPGPQGPGGPDLYTLLAWVELELALGTAVTVDAAHAVVSDLVEHAFGRRVFEWVGEALVAEGRDRDDLARLRADEFLAQRVLDRLRSRMAEDDEAPDPPDTDFIWTAYGPADRSGSRYCFRRAVRQRRQNRREALLRPRRPRVAGGRARAAR
ncbi:hypothetical protein [Geodermatophilus sp. URMC 64]